MSSKNATKAWYIKGRTGVYGPFTPQKLVKLVATGVLTRRHLLTSDTVEPRQWRSAGDFPVLWQDRSESVQRPPRQSSHGPNWERDIIARVAVSRRRFQYEQIDDLLILTPEGVCFAQKRKLTPMPLVESTSLEQVKLNDRLFRSTVRRIPWSEIDSVDVSWLCRSGAGALKSQRVGNDCCIHVKAAEPIRMLIPNGGADHVIDAFRYHIGDRVATDSTPFVDPNVKTVGRWFEQLGCLLLFPLVPLGLLSLTAIFGMRGWFRVDQGVPSSAVWRRVWAHILLPSVGTLLLLCVGIAFFFGNDVMFGVCGAICVIASMVASQYPLLKLRGIMLLFCRSRVAAPFTPEPYQHSWFERLCARWPKSLTTRPVAIVLKCLAIVILVCLYMLEGLLAAFTDLSRVDFVSALGLPVVTAIAYLGYRCSIGSASRLQAMDQRAPIVFLRSFQDDGCADDTFSIQSARASWLGLRSIHSLKALGPLADANPLRICRLLFGRGNDSSEEQLGSFLSRFGPFVAIGKPGEGLPTAGAARDYVGDTEWQEKVLRWVRSSRLVVIQPGSTLGIWWETEQVLGYIDRRRVVFSLILFARAPHLYESFALRLRALTGIDCPLYLGSSVFMTLDTQRGTLVPLQHASPFRWPVSGCSADFNAMLGEPLGQRQPPRSKEQVLAAQSTSLFTVYAAAVVWGLVVIAATLPIQLGVLLPYALLGQQIVEQELEDGAFTWSGTSQLTRASAPWSFAIMDEAGEQTLVGIGGRVTEVSFEVVRDSGDVQVFDRVNAEVWAALGGPEAEGYSEVDLAEFDSGGRSGDVDSVLWRDKAYQHIDGVLFYIRSSFVHGVVATQWGMCVSAGDGAFLLDLMDSARVKPPPRLGIDFGFSLPNGWFQSPSESLFQHQFDSTQEDFVLVSVVAPLPVGLSFEDACEELLSAKWEDRPELGLRVLARTESEPSIKGAQEWRMLAIESEKGVDGGVVGRRYISYRGWIYIVTAYSVAGQERVQELLTRFTLLPSAP